MAFKHLFSTLLLSISAFVAQSQCVVINEVLVNAAGACDGSCTPSTGEWFELYNTCTSSIDISCYVITDGDFAVTFPTGTFIEPNGFLVIGSINSGVAVDIDLGSCGCTSGGSNQIGIFTNSNEQLAFVDPFGEFQDGVFWGTGQFSATPSFTTDPIGTCNPQTIPLSQSNPIFVGVASQSNNEGFTINRACDGGDWQSGGQAPTPGATNGGSIASAGFSASSTSICAGDCIDFYNETVGTGNLTWNFDGSPSSSSNADSPTSVCYPSAGSFDVTLMIDGGCGSSSLTIEDYIFVSPLLSPTITVTGPSILCAGETTTLQANFTENIQWYNLNGPLVGETSALLTVAEQSNYYFTLSSGDCLYTSAPVEITVAESANAVLTLSGDAVLCPGESAMLSAPLGFDSYVWFQGTTVLPNSGNTLSVSTSGVYSLQGTIGTCSSTSAPVSITSVNNPTATISSPSNVAACAGETIQLETALGMSSYAWYQSGSNTVLTTNNSIELNANGNYYVVITDSNGCSDQSDLVSVSFDSAIEVTLSTLNDAPCAGDMTMISASTSSSVSSYSWYQDNQLLDGETAADLLTIESGAYTVTVESAAGCTYSSNPLNISITPLPIVSFLSPSEIISCESSVSVLASATGGAGGSWLWFDLDGNPIGTTNPVSISTSGTYSCTYTSINGCVGISAPIVVTLYTALPINIIADDTTPCAGESATLLVENNGGEILWSTNETTETIEVNTSGNVVVNVTFDNGCVATESIAINVQPLPIVNAGTDVEAICGIGTILDATAQGTFSWSPTSTLDNPNSINPLANPINDTYYTLTATLNGCTASAGVLVYTDCGIVKIPNVFTPNNDGINDTFEVLTFFVKTYHIEIYNRWGELVFTSDDEDTHWDGKINGNNAEDGTYYYMLQITGPEGESLIEKSREHGSLTLLR